MQTREASASSNSNVEINDAFQTAERERGMGAR